MYNIGNVPIGFPISQFSYDAFIHKKIASPDVIMAIPRGTKSVAWITPGVGVKIYLVENMTMRLVFENVTDSVFGAHIHNSSILMGVLCTISGRRVFCGDDVLFHRGNLCGGDYISHKLNIIRDIYEKMSPIVSVDEPTFSIPCMHVNFFELLKNIHGIEQYRIEFIKFAYGRKGEYLKYFKPRNIEMFNSGNNNNAPQYSNINDDNTHHPIPPSITNNTCIDKNVSEIGWKSSGFHINYNASTDILEESDDDA